MRRRWILRSWTSALRSSPKFAYRGFSEVAELGAHQAAHHPYHQLHGPVLAQLLLAYQRAPRLQVQGEGYGGEQRLAPLAACLERIGDSVPHRLPVAEEEDIVLL